MRRFGKALLASLAVVTTLVIGQASFAQVVPHSSRGTGVYDPVTGDAAGSGEGRQLGVHTWTNTWVAVPTADPLIFDVLSITSHKVVAANGDEIHFSFSGQLELVPLGGGLFSARWTLDFVVEGGTGRFARAQPAADPLRFVGVNAPFEISDPQWSFSWRLDGEIQLGG